MCGIVGYTGRRSCRELLLRGLERLEYRGYDSAGLALLHDDGRVETIHAVGNLSRLRAAVAAAAGSAGGEAESEALDAGEGRTPDDDATAAHTGIGHTRWATHGRVSEENAHPHCDPEGRVHIVLNGIVENWAELRTRLEARGNVFRSETDAEVVAHLIALHLDQGDPVEAVRRAYRELRGHYAFVALFAGRPGLLVAARKECPLVVGLGEGETFLASAIPAFLRHTRRIQLVEDDEIVVVTPQGARFERVAGALVEREVRLVDWDEDVAEKGGYETFMLKEIYEQPAAIKETIVDRLSDGIALSELGLTAEEARRLRRVVIVGCGTSYHAGLVGRYAIERWARVPVEMEIASEFRYRDPVLDAADLVLAITQSGETADTLAAMRLARERGARVIAVTNVMGSQATREADGVLYTRAGLEIGVAATKTFVAQVAVMLLLGLWLGEARGTLSSTERDRLITELRALPDAVRETIERVREPVRAIAEHWQSAGFFLYLGRHIGLPVCLEGALKLKEISYVPTDAYAAGEMKHGPIALLDERTPVVCVACDSPVLEKVLSNIAEVRARGAHVVAVATEGRKEVAEHAEEVIYVPRTDWMLQPIPAIVPLQLLAYEIARLRGLNVDQPRNLAKTVTVE
ncbi:glutamine--fructose-6-phosphate transaminase (isomerizing) [Thermoleophilum album]|uniref:Glutamine--fructose-6-phosphate aminotransferase [isomerizing] n=1 Tax=Thermoleophilum album TaxID=29539 RepID=A0A1H6FUT3_THEAL|nr:glutamine--fructose-6-phosphate transaminase (isomerizing) [Thermoleophilum album]SEH13763.1 glucosamine--fructose-6-phosphate aminotransferase (isomerizing) [Thermoleophilum album]